MYSIQQAHGSISNVTWKCVNFRSAGRIGGHRKSISSPFADMTRVLLVDFTSS